MELWPKVDVLSDFPCWKMSLDTKFRVIRKRECDRTKHRYSLDTMVQGGTDKYRRCSVCQSSVRKCKRRNCCNRTNSFRQRPVAYSSRHCTTDSDRVSMCYSKRWFNCHDTAWAPWHGYFSQNRHFSNIRNNRIETVFKWNFSMRIFPGYIPKGISIIWPNS